MIVTRWLKTLIEVYKRSIKKRKKLIVVILKTGQYPDVGQY